MANLVEMPGNTNWLRGNPTVGDSAASDLQLGGYQPEYGVKYPSNQHQANTTLTLATGKSMTAAQLGKVFNLWEDQWAEGWWFLAMPRRVTTELQHEWEVVTTPFTSFDLTPEGVGPRYVQEEQSKRSAKLTHWSQGSMVKAEFFMTQAGRDMFDRSKENVSMNAVRHQKNMVAINILSGIDAWRDYRKKYGTAYGSLYDVVQDGVRLFGAFNLDPKAIYKLNAEMLSWTEGHPKPPQINMGVTAKGTKMFILHGEPGNKPNPHSEMYRMGQGSVDSTLSNNFGPITTKVGFPIYEDQPVADSKNEGLFDPFERIGQYGNYLVLQNNEWGPPDAAGAREPAVQGITLPADKWRTFGFRDMITKCLRFDKSGALDQRFHRDLINRLPQLREHYDEATSSPDPYLVPIKGTRRNGMANDTWAIADLWGAQDPKWRSVDYDVRQGLQAALNHLTKEDKDLINRFMEAVGSVYNVPRATLTDNRENFVAFITEAEARTEPTWGGAALANPSIENLGAPYGMGSVSNMMSWLLQTNNDAAARGNWGYRDLNYDRVNAALNNLYRELVKTYDGMVWNNAAYCPIQHLTPDAAVNRRNAVLANCLEPHAKYPIFDMDGDAAADVGNWNALAGVGDVDATTNLVAQNGNVNVIKQKFAAATGDAALQIGGRQIGSLEELLQQFDDQTQRTNVLSGLVGYLQTLDLDDWRSGSITEERVMLWRDQPAARAPSANAAGAGGTQLRATIVGSAFADGRIGSLNPANPLNPAVALAGDEGEDAAFPAARGRYTAVAGDRPTYADRSRVVVGSEAAGAVDGPFLSFDVDGKKIVDRHFMVERLEAVAEMSDYVAAAFTRAFLGTRVTRQSCESMVKAGIPPPMNLMLANPFMRLRTAAYLLCEGGSALGEFLYSYMNSMFGLNTHHKVWEFNYTLWMGGFVKDETKILIKNDARLCGYESGMGDQFFERPEDYPGAHNNKPWETFPSMFVFDLPVDFDRERMVEHCNPAFLMGKPDAAYFGANISNKKHLLDPRKQTFPSWSYYDSIFHFADVNKNRAYGDQTYLVLRSMKNAPGVMLPRASRAFNGRKWKRNYNGCSHIDRLGEPPIMPTLMGKLTYGDQKPFQNFD